MSSRKKLIISLSVVALVVIAAVVAVVGVFAAANQQIESSVYITFTAVDIDGTVTANYKVQKLTTNELEENATNAGSVTFVATGTQTGSISIGSASARVNIPDSSSALYIQYQFTRADVDYTGALSFDHSLFKGEYLKGDTWTPLTSTGAPALEGVNAAGDTTVLMRITPKATANNIDADDYKDEAIMINWALNAK